MPNVISLREPGARQYLRRTNTDARLGRLCRTRALMARPMDGRHQADPI